MKRDTGLGKIVSDSLSCMLPDSETLRKEDEAPLLALVYIGTDHDARDIDQIREALARTYSQRYSERASSDMIDKMLKVTMASEKIYNPREKQRRDDID